MMVPLERYFTHTRTQAEIQPALSTADMRGCGCLCGRHMYVNSIIYGIIWRRYCLSNVMYDCQGNMKETGRKGEAHMHAENRYAVTYNDSSRMWKKKQGGKWERELKRRRVRNSVTEEERDERKRGGNWRGMERAGEKMRKSGKRAKQGSTAVGLFKLSTYFFGLKIAGILHQYDQFQTCKGMKACTASHQGWLGRSGF